MGMLVVGLKDMTQVVLVEQEKTAVAAELLHGRKVVMAGPLNRLARRPPVMALAAVVLVSTLPTLMPITVAAGVVDTFQ